MTSVPTRSASRAHSRYSLMSVAARVNPSWTGGVAMRRTLPVACGQQPEDQGPGGVGVDAAVLEEVGLQEHGGGHGIVDKRDGLALLPQAGAEQVGRRGRARPFERVGVGV